MEIIIVSIVFCIAFMVQGFVFYQLFVTKVKADKSDSLAQFMSVIEKKVEPEEPDKNIIPLEEMTESDL